MARQRGEDTLKRIAVDLPPAFSDVFDVLDPMKESHEVRSSQEEDEVAKEVEMGDIVAISVCKSTTWKGGEARATRRNL